MKSFVIYKETELQTIAHYILKQLPEFQTLLLKGDLGAGKTTFVKYFVHLLIPHCEVQSPTFSIINLYQNQHYQILHADLYRLKSQEELWEIGILESLRYADYALIEWYELLLPYIPKALIIDIQTDKEKRTFTLTPHYGS